jgi:hypothetical protein
MEVSFVLGFMDCCSISYSFIMSKKLIRISGYLRRGLKGKVQRLKPHPRRIKRESILRSRKALDELKNNPVEVGQLVSKSGRLSKTVTQDNKFKVDYVFKGKKAGSKAAATLHNHPQPYPKLKLTTSPPSSGDVLNTLKRGNYGLVVSAEGTQFRVSRGKKFDSVGEFETKILRQQVGATLDTFENRIKKMKNLTPDQVYLTRERLYQNLNKQGLIRYRVRPTPEVAARRKQFQTNADKILDWIFRD